MPLVVDGVEIPVEAIPNYQSFQKAKREIDDLIKAQNKQNAAIEARKQAVLAAASAEQKALAAAKKAQEDYRRSLNATRESAEKLQQVGTLALGAGASILGPLLLSAKNFVTKASEADAVANRWRESMASLENSSNRAGRVMAAELNPALEKSAALISDVVTMLEKNPDLMGAIGAVGGGLVAIGTLITVVAQVEKLVATMKLLSTGESALGALGAAAAPVVIIGLSVAAIAAIGAAIKGTEQNPTGEKGPIALPPGTTKEQYLAMLAKRNAAEAGTPAAALSNLPAYRGNGTDRTKDDIDKGMAAKATVATLARERIEEEKKAQKKITDIIEKYGKKKADILTSLESDNLKALESYQAQRAQVTRDAEVEITRITYDSKKKQQQIEKNHAQNVYDLTAARDALGLVKENQRYADEKKQEQDATRDEVTRRRYELRTKLQDLAQSYNAELRQRKAAADAKIKLLQQEQQAELTLLGQQSKMLYEMIAGVFGAAMKSLGATYSAPAGSTTGGSGSANINRATVRPFAEGGSFTIPQKYGHEGFRLGNLGTASAGERVTVSPAGSVAGMTVNINLGDGSSISSFRRIVAETKAQIVRELGNALEAA